MKKSIRGTLWSDFYDIVIMFTFGLMEKKRTTRLHYVLCTLLLLSLAMSSQAQSRWTLGYNIRTANIPALHSYAAAQLGDTILLVGGRKDGLHLRQPMFAFDSLSRNDSIWVYHYADNSYKGLALNNLPPSIAAQLSSTNPEYAQVGDYLYIAGGYGYDPSQQDHRTYGTLIALHIPHTLEHIYKGVPLDKSCYYSIDDDAFAVTGGVMYPYDGHLILAGGHRFDGVYNPVDNPTFRQKYHTKIVELQVDDEAHSFQILRSISDTVLRRRDLSATVAQVDGADMLILYAGVFRPDVKFPYQHVLEYQHGKLREVENFRQSLSTYHTAHLDVDRADLPAEFSMGEVFLGGLAPYYIEDSILIYDTDVPFTYHISMLLRDRKGDYSEYKHSPSLPAFLGTASQVFAPTIQRVDQPKNLGFFIGGIQSPERNVFWSAKDSPSVASPYIVDLYLESCQNAWSWFKYSESPYEIDIFPDSDYTKFTVHWKQGAEKVLMEIYNVEGARLFSQYFETPRPVIQSVDLPASIMSQNQFQFHFKGKEEYWFEVMNND